MTSNLFTARRKKQQPPKVCIKGPLYLPPAGPLLGSTLQCAAGWKGKKLNPASQYVERFELFKLDSYLGGLTWETTISSPSGFFFAHANFNEDFTICDLWLRSFEMEGGGVLIEFTQRPTRSATPLNTGFQYEKMFNWIGTIQVTQ